MTDTSNCGFEPKGRLSYRLFPIHIESRKVAKKRVASTTNREVAGSNPAYPSGVVAQW